MACTSTASPAFAAYQARQKARTQLPRSGFQRGDLSIASRRQSSRGCRLLRLEARAEGGKSSSFVSGFILGGVVFGALGFLFAPQISAALLNDEQKLRLPRFLEEEEKDPEATKQDLADKIAQLNSAIDDVSAQLKAQDAVPAEAEVTA